MEVSLPQPNGGRGIICCQMDVVFKEYLSHYKNIEYSPAACKLKKLLVWKLSVFEGLCWKKMIMQRETFNTKHSQGPVEKERFNIIFNAVNAMRLTG